LSRSCSSVFWISENSLRAFCVFLVTLSASFLASSNFCLHWAWSYSVIVSHSLRVLPSYSPFLTVPLGRM
jgi:hypothetical protein